MLRLILWFIGSRLADLTQMYLMLIIIILAQHGGLTCCTFSRPCEVADTNNNAAFSTVFRHKVMI
jgi:hypothetical protein